MGGCVVVGAVYTEGLGVGGAYGPELRGEGLCTLFFAPVSEHSTPAPLLALVLTLLPSGKLVL